MKRLIPLIGMLIITVSVCAIDLKGSIELALQNNKNLQMAAEEIAKADNQYREVRGYLLPQINLQGAYQIKNTRLPDSAIPGSFDFSSGLDSLANSNEQYLAAAMNGVMSGLIPSKRKEEGSLAMQLKFEQVLFLGGKLINGIKAVDRYRSIQKRQYQLSEQELKVKTTELFYQCLLLAKLVQVQEEAYDIAQRHLNRVQILNTEGQVSEFDLLRAELEVAKLGPQLLQARNNYELVLASFHKHIGSDEAIPEGEFELPIVEEENLQAAIEKGKRDRIELTLADIATEIMQIRYNAEKGNYLPNVALTADYSIFSAADEYAIERKDFGNQFTVGIGFQIPLFTGFSNTSKRAYARHDYAQAKLQQAEAVDMIELQIRMEHQKLAHARQNYLVQQKNIGLAQRALELAQIRYESQVGIQLEVFDAQVMLAAVKLQYYQSIWEVISADVNYKKAIGIKL